MGILDDFFRGLSRKVTVDVCEASFRFESSISSVELHTFLCVSNRDDTPKIVSIGEEPNDTVDFEKVELFSSQHQSDKLDVLIYFVKHGLSLVTSKMALIRPTVFCKGIANFNDIFHGYQHGIFQRVFEEAGAMMVHIKE